MNYHLVVVHPFKAYEKGTMITDADEVARVLESPQHTFVVKIAAPDKPAEPSRPSPLFTDAN